MDLTWLGWFFVIDMSLSVLIWTGRGVISGGYVKTGAECYATAVVTALYLLGFATIGFTHG